MSLLGRNFPFVASLKSCVSTVGDISLSKNINTCLRACITPIEELCTEGSRERVNVEMGAQSAKAELEEMKTYQNIFTLRHKINILKYLLLL